jgi:hypothetical protein
MAQARRQHEYLELPGAFNSHLPHEVIFPNMDSGRMDECYLNDEDTVIMLEEESDEITPAALRKFTKYIIFLSYMHYPKEVLLCVICHKKPKKDFEVYKHGPSCHIKVFYHYLPQEELNEKYENVINKVKQKEELTETEALDIAFVSKYISQKDTPEVIKALSYAFKNAKINDKLLRIDVGVILGAMILKRIEDLTTQNKLLKVIGMETFKSDIQKLVYDEFGDELDLKDQEIKEKNDVIKSQAKELKSQAKELKSKTKELSKITQTNNKYKNKVEQLKQIGDLDSPKAKKIIESLMLL